jgi:cell division protein FtsQ
MIPEPFKMLTPDLQKVFIAASALSKQSFTLALTEQLFLNNQGELELIPKIGDQIIVLGDTTHLAEKIENLNTFYTRGMQAEGWNNYRSISLKYRNQVICTKTTQNGSI